MDIYSILAIPIRLVLSHLLFQKGKRALLASTRNGVSMLYLVCTVSILIGFFTNVTTLILLIHLGLNIWRRRQQGVSIQKELILLLLTLIVFAKAAGAFSLDHLLGNM